MDTDGMEPKLAGSILPAVEELNLLEWPMAMLSDYSPDGIKTLQFRDRIKDAASGQELERTVTITGSDAFGLPTAADQDILLALMMLTEQKNQWREKRVGFTIYELCKLLDWATDGKNYDRIATSLDRWMGVTVFYSHWRSEGIWKQKESFHLLEHYKLTRKKNYASDEPQTFLWNELVWSNMRLGHRRGLDWKFYISLKTPTAKRLYRFLIKRFYLNKKQKFDVVEFCQNKLGMSRDYPASKYKQKLKPAIRELEERKFLKAMTDAERYRKVSKGRFNVAFIRGSLKSSVIPIARVPEATTENPLEAALLARGVTNAAKLVQEFPEERIAYQIENFDDRQLNGNEVSAGWLRKAVEENYGCRKGFKTKQQNEEEEKARLEKQKKRAIRAALEKAHREAEQKHEDAAKREAVENYMGRFVSEEEREAFFEKARVTKTCQFANRYYEKALNEQNDDDAMMWRNSILEQYIATIEKVGQ